MPSIALDGGKDRGAAIRISICGMTISRIADGECTACIPLPTPRPDAVSAKVDLAATPKQVPAEPEYIEFTTDRSETKMIRLVVTN